VAYDLDEKARANLAGRPGIATAASPAELVRRLQSPRMVLLMVNAGAATDRAIESLQAELAPGDILIDGGNAHYLDSMRRAEALAAAGLRFLGLGISGGAEGARHGPALMAGGDASAYRALEPVLAGIAAKAGGRACLGYFGADGAGHFVKMAHNAIEYAVMAAIAEAWFLLRHLAGLDHAGARRQMAEWNRGQWESYLLEIAIEVLAAEDAPTGQPFIEVIQDRAEQKGTGAWAVEAGLSLGVPIPSLAEAVFQRSLSSLKAERQAAERTLGSPIGKPAAALPALLASLPAALRGATIAAHAQGLRLIQAGAAEHGWSIDPAAVAAVWQGGCILRARLLETIEAAYRGCPSLVNLMLDANVAALMAAALPGWRESVAAAAQSGIAVPVTGSALAYADGYRIGRGPAALIQAQRDRFGGHGLELIGRSGVHHGPWSRTS
jgi:6-phosphogluconate dehydrogenase